MARQLIVVAAPKTAEGLAEAVARFPFNALLLVFGTEVNAGYQIATRIYQQITAPLSRAFRVTASITAGQALGEGDAEKARFEGWAIVALGALVVGTIGVLLVLAAEPLAGLFTGDTETLRESVRFIRVYGIVAAPFVIFSALSGSLQGAGETRLPLLGRMTGLFGFFVGFSYIAGVIFDLGSVGAYAGVGLSYTWMALVLLWSFARTDWAGRASNMIQTREAASE